MYPNRGYIAPSPQKQNTKLLTSVSGQVLQIMADIRKKHPQFIAWHEGYAFINKEMRAFKYTASNLSWNFDNVVMCPNCSEFYQSFLKKCPRCLFPNFSQNTLHGKELETIQSALIEMGNILKNITALTLLTISECGVFQKDWGEVFDHLFALIGEVEYYQEDLEEDIKTFFDNYILNNFNEFWNSIKRDEDTIEGDKAKEKYLYLTAAYSVLLNIFLAYNANLLNIPNKIERKV